MINQKEKVVKMLEILIREKYKDWRLVLIRTNTSANEKERKGKGTEDGMINMEYDDDGYGIVYCGIVFFY